MQYPIQILSLNKALVAVSSSLKATGFQIHCQLLLSVNSFVLSLTNEPAGMSRLRTQLVPSSLLQWLLPPFRAITETLDFRKYISMNIINLTNHSHISMQHYFLPLTSMLTGRGENKRLGQGLKLGALGFQFRYLISWAFNRVLRVFLGYLIGTFESVYYKFKYSKQAKNVENHNKRCFGFGSFGKLGVVCFSPLLPPPPKKKHLHLVCRRYWELRHPDLRFGSLEYPEQLN